MSCNACYNDHAIKVAGWRKPNHNGGCTALHKRDTTLLNDRANDGSTQYLDNFIKGNTLCVWVTMTACTTCDHETQGKRLEVPFPLSFLFLWLAWGCALHSIGDHQSMVEKPLQARDKAFTFCIGDKPKAVK